MGSISGLGPSSGTAETITHSTAGSSFITITTTIIGRTLIKLTNTFGLRDNLTKVLKDATPSPGSQTCSSWTATAQTALTTSVIFLCWNPTDVSGTFVNYTHTRPCYTKYVLLRDFPMWKPDTHSLHVTGT